MPAGPQARARATKGNRRRRSASVQPLGRTKHAGPVLLCAVRQRWRPLRHGLALTRATCWAWVMGLLPQLRQLTAAVGLVPVAAWRSRWR